MLSQIQVELQDPELCEEVTNGVNAVVQRLVLQFRLEGNAWDLVADAHGVEFTYSLMDGDPGGNVSLKTYLKALDAWRQLIVKKDCEGFVMEISEE